MPNSTPSVSRRTILRGVGASVALPWLEGMGTSTVRAAEAGAMHANTPGGKPVRLAGLFMPNGVHPKEWTPEGEGREFQLSTTLAPLEEVKDAVLVLSNLRNAGSLTGDGHYVKTAGFLTGTTISKTTGRDLNCGGTSMDQVAARQVGKQTPFPSLELGTEPVSRGIDANVGYTRLYGSHIAWRTPTMPLTKEIRPRAVFNRLFRANLSGEDASVLDLVQEDAKQLARQLGTNDRHKLDEYLDSVRSLEQRVDAAMRDERLPSEFTDEGEPLLPPPGVPARHAEHVRLMLDMIVLAFQTDSTRIATFMFGNSVSGKDFSFLDGVKGGHHQLSHHENKEEKLAQYRRINEWHVAQLAYLCKKLKAIPEGDGTLLDNCMILFGSGLRDGNRHDPNNLPIILAGGGGGSLETGRHLVYPKHTPLCNLYVSMLERLGTPVERFGDSTGPLAKL